jgi:hypothetical protein
MDPKNSESAQDGNLRHAAHGLFAKIQEKTGLDDKKIDEFQKKWLETPEVRTKYRHWWDSTAIAGEELYAMFNDIIDFVQDQEGGKSHVFATLREEADQVRKNPQAYFRHLVVVGKSWMDRRVGAAKSWMGGKGAGGVPPTKIEEPKAPPASVPDKEEISEADQTDEEWFGGGEKERGEATKADKRLSAPKAKPKLEKRLSVPTGKGKTAPKKPAKKTK